MKLKSTWRMICLTWYQEQRSSIIPCPVTILSLQVAVEVHPFQSSIHSCVGSWGTTHKLALWIEQTTQIYYCPHWQPIIQSTKSYILIDYSILF